MLFRFFNKIYGVRLLFTAWRLLIVTILGEIESLLRKIALHS